MKQCHIDEFAALEKGNSIKFHYKVLSLLRYSGSVFASWIAKLIYGYISPLKILYDIKIKILL